MLLLTSCVSAAVPEETTGPTADASASAEAGSTPDAGGEESAEPTPEAPEPEWDVPDPLTFEAGVDLDPELIPQWSDPYLADEDFESSIADDGNGGWGYRHIETQCEVIFWQGRIELGDGDDSELSDLLLAHTLGADVSQVTPQAEDLPGAFQTITEGTVDARVLRANDPNSGANGIFAARSFGAVQSGVTVRLECPEGQDATVMWERLTTEYRGLTLMIMPLLG